jgi:hypothetical protein
MKIVIVYDSDHPDARKNKCFTKEFALKGSGHSFTVELANQAIQNGFEIITADVFLQRQPDANTNAYCITDMVTTLTNTILERGAIPFICFSMESPLIAKDFYVNISKLSGRFNYSIQFKGAFERLRSSNSKFITMHFPVPERLSIKNKNEWDSRKFLIVVNSNKRAFFSDYSTVKTAIRSVASQLKFTYLRLVDPWMRTPEFYKDRIELIRYFAGKPGFALYGIGWNNPIAGFPKVYHEAAKKVDKGPLPYEKKLAVMNEYKFAVCFENCAFPGYVTEKIFDCFLAGTIPIYFGPEDITEFVPRNTFIDFRDFKDFKALETFIGNFTSAEAEEKLKAADAFLQSRAFEKHYLPNFISDIVDKIKHHSNSQLPN